MFTMDARLYVEGAIYYYENKTNTKKNYYDESINHDFMVSRPVFVLESPKLPFKTFTIHVLAITSSPDRIGIPINIDGHREGKILPYSIHSIHPEYLREYMGQASEEIIQQVRLAVDFHLGRSEIKPIYLTSYEERMKFIENMYNEMTLRERVLYHFLKDRCTFKSKNYVSQEELFSSYQQFAGKKAYDRMSDFTRSLNKIMNVLPEIQKHREGKSYIFYGMSVKKLEHDITLPGGKKAGSFQRDKSLPQGKRVYEHTTAHIIELHSNKSYCRANDPLIDKISEPAFQAYRKMDIIEKINNFKKTINLMDISRCPEDDLPLVKQMIENDVQQMKEKLFNLLDNGENPMNLSSAYQFLLYNCNNTEVIYHTNKKWMKRYKGIYRLKGMLKNNIRHYFVRLKL